jgi:DNA/RNA endonuclease YhcR with UshA esterase domain
MKTKILLFAIAVVLLSSCSVVKTYTAKTTEIYGSGVIQKPVIVDLEVTETKVSGTATESSGIGLEAIKNLAVANAVKKAGADVLIEPQFETETRSGMTTATVTGFPGIYRNFRPIQIDDVELLKVGILQKANVYQPSSEEKKKLKLR